MGQICGKAKKVVAPKTPKEGNAVEDKTTDVQSEKVRETSLVNENVSKEVKEGLVNTFENSDVVEEANAKPDVKEEEESKSKEVKVADDKIEEIKVSENQGAPLDNLKDQSKDIKEEPEKVTGEKVEEIKDTSKDVKEEQEKKSEEVKVAGDKVEEIKEAPKDLPEENGIQKEYTSTPQNSVSSSHSPEAPPPLINNEVINTDVFDKIVAPEAEKQTDDSVLAFGDGDPNIPSDKVTALVTQYLDKVEDENDDNSDSSFTVVEKTDAEASNDDVKAV